jgi:hypothetical protein
MCLFPGIFWIRCCSIFFFLLVIWDSNWLSDILWYLMIKNFLHCFRFLLWLFIRYGGLLFVVISWYPNRLTYFFIWFAIVYLLCSFFLICLRWFIFLLFVRYSNRLSNFFFFLVNFHLFFCFFSTGNLFFRNSGLFLIFILFTANRLTDFFLSLASIHDLNFFFLVLFGLFAYGFGIKFIGYSLLWLTGFFIWVSSYSFLSSLLFSRRFLIWISRCFIVVIWFAYGLTDIFFSLTSIYFRNSFLLLFWLFSCMTTTRLLFFDSYRLSYLFRILVFLWIILLRLRMTRWVDRLWFWRWFRWVSRLPRWFGWFSRWIWRWFGRWSRLCIRRWFRWWFRLRIFRRFRRW